MKNKILLMIISICLFAGCNGFFGDETGSVSIEIIDGVSRTILPEISMVPVTYYVSGKGPDDFTFSRTITETNAEIDSVPAGNWVVQVSAENNAGIIIGEGSTSVIVTAGSSVAASIDITPLSGTGYLEYKVNWLEGELTNPEITAVLLSPEGEEIVCSSSYIQDNYALISGIAESGYYTLSVSVFDRSSQMMGAVDAVRIVSGHSTSGSLQYVQNVNQEGSVDVVVNLLMNNPLELEISGNETELLLGEALNISAVINEVGVNARYSWFVSGTLAGSSSSFTYTPKSAGNLRIDVVAFSDDNKRAGSSSFDILIKSNEKIKYNLGDTGPAGGVIIYDKGDFSDGWQYIEISPVSIGSAIWSSELERVEGAEGSKPGDGYQNTLDIVSQYNTADIAAALCYLYSSEYKGVNYDDWFLPSSGSISRIFSLLLYPGIIENIFDCDIWTSTQVNDTGGNTDLYNSLVSFGTYSQDLIAMNSGAGVNYHALGLSNKQNEKEVWPVRRF